MSDDWRVTIDLGEGGVGADFVEGFRERGLEREVHERLGGRVAISHDGPHVFLYAEDGEQAGEAESIVGPALERHGLRGAIALERWHPIEERWEDASVPLPQTEAEKAVERARHEADAASESIAQGLPEWEVRLTLPSHSAARDLAERLEDEGISLVRRWRHLLVGAETEEAAHRLVERLRAEAPAEARFEVEANGLEVWRAAQHPVARFLGGLGGG